MQGLVLIVEDDLALRQSLSTTLRALDYVVTEAASGELAFTQLKTQPFDLVLLDLSLPGLDGIATCQKIRNLRFELPIIVLTVRNADSDKLAAFDAGADDYVTKPFQLPELEARMRAALRRGRRGLEHSTSVLTSGDIHMDPARHRVTKNGKEVHLTPKEFALLHLLMMHAGKTLPHEQLLSFVWGPTCGKEREYLRTYVNQLRRKLEDRPAEPRYLLTENYIGYRFEAS